MPEPDLIRKQNKHLGSEINLYLFFRQYRPEKPRPYRFIYRLVPQGGEPQGVEPQGGEPQGVEPQGVEPQGEEPQEGEPQGGEPQGG